LNFVGCSTFTAANAGLANISFTFLFTGHHDAEVANMHEQLALKPIDPIHALVR